MEKSNLVSTASISRNNDLETPALQESKKSAGDEIVKRANIVLRKRSNGVFDDAIIHMEVMATITPQDIVPAMRFEGKRSVYLNLDSEVGKVVGDIYEANDILVKEVEDSASKYYALMKSALSKLLELGYEVKFEVEHDC
jgi:hypothetical protein